MLIDSAFFTRLTGRRLRTANLWPITTLPDVGQMHIPHRSAPSHLKDKEKTKSWLRLDIHFSPHARVLSLSGAGSILILFIFC